MAFFWDRFKLQIGLTDKECESKKMILLASGRSEDGKCTDYFLRPCLKTIVRMAWVGTPTQSSTWELNIDQADYDQLGRFFSGMRAWHPGACESGFLDFIGVYCSESPHLDDTMVFPRSTFTYGHTPLKKLIDSLYHFQLFDAQNRILWFGPDVGTAIGQLGVYTDMHPEYEKVAHTLWSYDDVAHAYRHPEGFTVLRERVQSE